MSKEELVRMLEEMKPKETILEGIEKRAADIRRVIGTLPAYRLGLKKKPQDIDNFINKLHDFRKVVEIILKDSDQYLLFLRNRYGMKKRLVLPKFQIENSGNCPAESIVIYIEEPIQISFRHKDDEGSFNFPFEMSNDEAALLNIFNNLDNLLLAVEKTQEPIYALADLSTTGLGLSAALSSSLLGTTTPKAESSSYVVDRKKDSNIILEDKRLRIDFDKLKHHFVITIENNFIYLISFLDENEKVNLEYTCYADNLPDPIEGRLLIKARGNETLLV